jgi:hypothetical protein
MARMESYTPPVGPNDPYKRYRVEEIQKDRKGMSGKGPNDPKNDKSPILALVLHLLRRLFQLFDPPTPRRIPSSARIHILLFRAALETLKKEDKSQDVVFLGRLADVWRDLLDSQEKFPALKPWIAKIQSYPETHEYSLGYYLSEYTSGKWLPFPFLEIVQKLHKEHRQNPSQSTLLYWTLQIDAVLPLLV